MDKKHIAILISIHLISIVCINEEISGQIIDKNIFFQPNIRNYESHVLQGVPMIGRVTRFL